MYLIGGCSCSRNSSHLIIISKQNGLTRSTVRLPVVCPTLTDACLTGVPLQRVKRCWARAPMMR